MLIISPLLTCGCTIKRLTGRPGSDAWVGILTTRRLHSLCTSASELRRGAAIKRLSGGFSVVWSVGPPENVARENLGIDEKWIDAFINWP